MKIKSLSILTIGALLLCAPLLAQTEGQEPYDDQPALEEPAVESHEAFEAEEPAGEPMAAETESFSEADAETDGELPKTASPLPLLALLGLGAVSIAFGLRVRRSSR